MPDREGENNHIIMFSQSIHSITGPKVLGEVTDHLRPYQVHFYIAVTSEGILFAVDEGRFIAAFP